jgi:hypothetical protein
MNQPKLTDLGDGIACRAIRSSHKTRAIFMSMSPYAPHLVEWELPGGYSASMISVTGFK